MPAAMPLTNKISQSSNRRREYNIISTQYGNGYEQRAVDGTNPVKETWTLVWEALTLSEYQTVQSALDTAAGADYFTWTAFGDSTSKKWVQVGPAQLSPMSGALFSISAQFKVVYDL